MAAMPWTLIAPLAVAAALTAPDPGAIQGSALGVRVYDTVGMRGVDIQLAAQTADGLLGRVGVRVDWTVCSVNPVERSDDKCAAPPGAWELIVRLANGSTVSPSALGFAYTPGIVATALIDRIQQTSRRTARQMPALLGAVITHELVHLLLGAASHSPQGVMLPAWADRDIQEGRIFLIKLTADERRALEDGLRERLLLRLNSLPHECAGARCGESLIR
jgi:hypothetical protein